MKNQLLSSTLLVTIMLVAFSVNVLSKEKKKEGKIKKSYHVETDNELTWPDAYQFCKFHDMTLASVHNKVEQKAIKDILMQHKYRETGKSYWLSGAKVGNATSTYAWMSSGRKMIYKNWEANYPSSDGCKNYCVATTAKVPCKWMDYACSKILPFICEYYNADSESLKGVEA